MSQSQRRLFLGAALLLLLAASRIAGMNHVNLTNDEVWSGWQMLGSASDALRWTPFDWPPLYFISLKAWTLVAGIHPLALRTFSVLIFLIGVAVLYRVVLRLRDMRTAVMVALAYAALGFVIHMSIEIRGYVLMFTLMLAAFWLTLRYFDHPTTRRGLLLGLALAAMFYTYLPSVVGFVMLGLYTLIVYRRWVWRWWLPALVLVTLAVPLLLFRLDSALDRGFLSGSYPGPDVLADYYKEFTVFTLADYPFELWVALLALASLATAARWRSINRQTWAMGAWMFAMPLLMYAISPVAFLFFNHYSMLLLLGIALWIGWGLASLPRAGYVAALALLAGLSLHHFDRQYLTSFQENFAWLSQQYQTGDVVLIDPVLAADDDVVEVFERAAWPYFTAVYFPNGLQFVTRPEGHRRIWYVTNETDFDAAMYSRVSENRLAREFVGPPGFLFRLYEAPPDPTGIPYDNGLRFHGLDIIGADGQYETGPLVTRHEGETIRLRLWWSVDRPPEADYSVATHLLNADGQLVAQVDGPPQTVSLEYLVEAPPRETSQWQPGRYYVEERTLALPYPMLYGWYDLKLVVYQWWDGARIAAPGVDANNLLQLQRVNVAAY